MAEGERMYSFTSLRDSRDLAAFCASPFMLRRGVCRTCEG